MAHLDGPSGRGVLLDPVVDPGAAHPSCGWAPCSPPDGGRESEAGGEALPCLEGTCLAPAPGLLSALTCGEADNPARQTSTHHAQTGHFQRSRRGTPCLPRDAAPWRTPSPSRCVTVLRPDPSQRAGKCHTRHKTALKRPNWSDVPQLSQSRLGILPSRPLRTRVLACRGLDLVGTGYRDGFRMALEMRRVLIGGWDGWRRLSQAVPSGAVGHVDALKAAGRDVRIRGAARGRTGLRRAVVNTMEASRT